MIYVILQSITKCHYNNNIQGLFYQMMRIEDSSAITRTMFMLREREREREREKEKKRDRQTDFMVNPQAVV